MPLVVALVSWPSFCFSDSIAPYSGVTPNAAATGQSWNMDNILPPGVPGLDINAVIYRYTIRKNAADSATVHIQNENATGSGYIFRESDEWTVGSLDGTSINKAVPVIPSLPREVWGRGSIEVDGQAQVENPTVIYNYRVNPCYDAQFDPNCPGYKEPTIEIPTVDLTTLYDVTQDSNVDLDRSTDTDLVEVTEEDQKSDDEIAEEEEKEKEDREDRLDKALAEVDNSLMFAQALAQSQMLAAVNAATNMNSYYATTIPGGVYKETVVLEDKQLPNSKRGLRNGLAQQLLHEKMINMQYGK